MEREARTAVLGWGAEGWSSGTLASSLFVYGGLSLLSFLSALPFIFLSFFPLPSLLPRAEDISQCLLSPLLKLHLFVR